MEPPTKRQRLLKPSSFYDDGVRWHQHLHSSESDLEQDELNAGSSSESVASPKSELDLDPDEELELKRQYVQQKTRSAFEAIFEKYGKSFDGVGDEVDLRTGRILVDNGHLMKMEDERDAGNAAANDFPEGGFHHGFEDANRSESDEAFSEDACSAENIDDDESTVASVDGSMLEDDIILRGLCPTSFHLHPPDRPPSLRRRRETRSESMSNIEAEDAMPSDSQIIAQFGPDLGPGVVKYVTKQRKFAGSHAESVGRSLYPPKLSVAHTIPDVVKQAIDVRRTSSPQGAASVWAAPRRRASISTIDSEADASSLCLKASNFSGTSPRKPAHRPARIRKPAQKDATIIGWSQAVEVIEKLDPREHAELLADAKGTQPRVSPRAQTGDRSQVLPSSIPDSQASVQTVSQGVDMKASLTLRKSCSTTKLNFGISQIFAKVKKPAVKTPKRKRKSLPASLTQGPPKLKSTAIRTGERARFSIRSPLLEYHMAEDDVDELSLGPSEVKFLFSRPLPNRLKSAETRSATSTGTENPTPKAVLQLRKERVAWNDNQGEDELDELSNEKLQPVRRCTTVERPSLDDQHMPTLRSLPSPARYQEDETVPDYGECRNEPAPRRLSHRASLSKDIPENTGETEEQRLPSSPDLRPDLRHPQTPVSPEASVDLVSDLENLKKLAQEALAYACAEETNIPSKTINESLESDLDKTSLLGWSTKGKTDDMRLLQVNRSTESSVARRTKRKSQSTDGIDQTSTNVDFEPQYQGSVSKISPCIVQFTPPTLERERCGTPLLDILTPLIQKVVMTKACTSKVPSNRDTMTPDRNARKCGRDGFFCGKQFCFKCTMCPAAHQSA